MKLTPSNVVNFEPSVAARFALQGDLCIGWIAPGESKAITGRELKRSETGDMRLLEGEVTGHHHTVLRGFGTPAPAMFRDDGLARSMETEQLVGTAVLYEDQDLLRSIPWLTRQDLAIGVLDVSGGHVMLAHPEHDTIRLPEGRYYVGRQVESAGAEERVVAD